MSTGTKVNSVFKHHCACIFVLCVVGAFFSTIAYARDQECSFAVKPVSVCEISFYRLLAAPKKYDRKYISVVGYVAISNGRLAVYPTELSYKLSIEQDSFSIRIPMKKRKELADNMSRHYARIVGLFNYQIDKIPDFNPGIGYISKIVDAHLVDSRPDVPGDHYLKGTPKEISQ